MSTESHHPFDYPTPSLLLLLISPGLRAAPPQSPPIVFLLSTQDDVPHTLASQFLYFSAKDLYHPLPEPFILSAMCWILLSFRDTVPVEYKITESHSQSKNSYLHWLCHMNWGYCSHSLRRQNPFPFLLNLHWPVDCLVQKKVVEVMPWEFQGEGPRGPAVPLLCCWNTALRPSGKEVGLASPRMRTHTGNNHGSPADGCHPVSDDVRPFWIFYPCWPSSWM